MFILEFASLQLDLNNWCVIPDFVEQVDFETIAHVPALVVRFVRHGHIRSWRRIRKHRDTEKIFVAKYRGRIMSRILKVS